MNRDKLSIGAKNLKNMERDEQKKKNAIRHIDIQTENRRYRKQKESLNVTQNNSKKLFNVKTFNDERYSKNQDFYSVSYIIF